MLASIGGSYGYWHYQNNIATTPTEEIPITEEKEQQQQETTPPLQLIEVIQQQQPQEIVVEISQQPIIIEHNIQTTTNDRVPSYKARMLLFDENGRFKRRLVPQII
jgi:hypothetical protein